MNIEESKVEEIILKEEGAAENNVIPYSVLQEYLTLHEQVVLSYINQVNQKISEKSEVEQKIYKSFIKLHKFLSDNLETYVDQKKYGYNMELIIKTIMNVQQKYMHSQDNQSRDLKQVIVDSIRELKEANGISFNEEVEKILTSMLGISDSMDSHFSQVFNRLDSLEENVIKAISDKDQQKQQHEESLKQKDEEIKSKQKIISYLQRDKDLAKSDEKKRSEKDQKKIQDLNKQYKTLKDKSESNSKKQEVKFAGKNEEIKKMKEQYEKIIAEKIAEIEDLRNQIQLSVVVAMPQFQIQNLDITNFFIDSACIKSNEQRLYLRSLIKKLKVITTKLYQGKRDGFKGAKFHELCDNQGTTVALYQIQNGPCIGGLTTAQWESCEILKRKNDPEALIFNLTNEKHYPVKNPDSAIFCRSNNGPSFGMGELYCLEPFNEPENLAVYGFGDAFNFPQETNDAEQKTKMNELTMQPGNLYTIEEIEVWKLEFPSN